jgi:hypothetical protein
MKRLPAYLQWALILLASAVAFVIIVGAVVWATGSSDADAIPSESNSVQRIEGWGKVYTGVITVDGRQIPCVVSGSGITCDWSAK